MPRQLGRKTGRSLILFKSPYPGHHRRFLCHACQYKGTPVSRCIPTQRFRSFRVALILLHYASTNLVPVTGLPNGGDADAADIENFDQLERAAAPTPCTTGVSLHSHISSSEETLDIIQRLLSGATRWSSLAALLAGPIVWEVLCDGGPLLSSRVDFSLYQREHGTP